ncbi:NADP-dependent oxidoreductase [Streptacidiphilus sp. PB12-B1b]|uniref:NADP-dependent oxidoreductase n=1 Tax=Streptacidiphilus sp. PB12-B1b TaxID=2705012 RepID=UPI0015F937A5|nr:NADP-dependent oxidoreductase [Streptacidiphilus sp. PB12-B1b]QMU76721.1 NADP-dependent oxidoreductase [Streptacidiphilus sp. PB12-B1b]
MKAVSYRAYGGPEALEYGERPDPKVGPDSVLVRVKAAAVNPVDWKLQSGAMDAIMDVVFPVVPGWDVAGVVEKVGPAVIEFSPGDEVFGYVREDLVGRGTFAEYVSAPLRTLAHKPAGLSFEQAAGVPLAGLTAYQALNRGLELRSGETLLVHAASGGVGSFAVQIARTLGARVIGTASEANHAYLRSLGAEPVPYGDGLAEAVRGHAPEGVDAVLDLVGGEALEASFGLLRDGGHGRVASTIDPAVAARGGRYVFVRPDRHDLDALAALADDGRLRVDIAATFPLERAADAQRFNAEGHTRGKVVVTVA